MHYSVVILLVALAFGPLTLARPDGNNRTQRELSFSRTFLYKTFEPTALLHRVPRNVEKVLDSKLSPLLKLEQKIKSLRNKESVACCNLAEPGELMRPESAATIYNAKYSLDILLRNNTGPLTLAALLEDLQKDNSELNLPEGVELSNQAVVEALLSKNVLIKYPLTSDNGIVIADYRTLVSCLQSGKVKFPLRDRVGRILRDLTDALPDGTKEVLGTLLGGNVVSDILESGALGCLNYPIKDANGIPVLDEGFLLFLVAQGGFKSLNFPMVNAYGVQLYDENDLLLILIDGGFLKNLVYPIKDSNGLVIHNKQEFLKAAREGLAFRGLKYPIRDSFGISIKRPDALMGALLDDNAARAVGFPLTDCQGAVIKDKLQLFLTLVDGGLDLVTFPLRDAQGYYFKDKLAFLIAIIEALRDKQGLVGLLQRSVSAISKFPLTDNVGNSMQDKTVLLGALLTGEALAGLNFPITDVEGKTVPNESAFILELLNNGLASLELPLSNRVGRMLNNAWDVVDALMDGSTLMKLKFPLADKRGRLVNDKDALLQGVFNNKLKFPLTDCAGHEVKDLAELICLLLSGDALENLQFPLFDGLGGVIKNKADFLVALLKAGLGTLKFPITDGNGGVLKALEDLLACIFDKSVLAKLVFPIKDLTGVILNNKMDLLNSLLGNCFCMPNSNLTDVMGGVIKDVDSLLESALGGLKLLNFPLSDAQGGQVNDSSQLLADMLKEAPGLKAVQFPLTDKNGRVLYTKEELVDILCDPKALSALAFPLTDCAGTVFKYKNDFLRRLLKGLTTLKFPLQDGMGMTLPNGKSLLETLLLSILALLKPVLLPLADILKPVTSIIGTLLAGDLSLLESLLSANSTASGLKFPLLDASGRNITSPEQFFELFLYGALNGLYFPLRDDKGHVLSDKKDFLEHLLKAGPLSGLQFPLRDAEGAVLVNKLAFITAILSGSLQSKDFPITAANGLVIKSKFELLVKLFNFKALESLCYPLVDKKGKAITSQQALVETLLEAGLNSFSYPIFDSGDMVIKDKYTLAEMIRDGLLPRALEDQTKPKPKTGVLLGILKLLGDKSSLSGNERVLLKAIKHGTVRETDLKDLLGNQKFSVLKDKLTAAGDGTNPELMKILDALVPLLLKEKPQMVAKLGARFDDRSFT